MKTKMEVPFYLHNIKEEDILSIERCLKQPFLATGKGVEEFERKLSEFTGLPFTVGVSSCTAALHLSLVALGIGLGDEVITTPLTYIATANVIEYVRARPIFVDVRWDTGLLNVEKVLGATTKRTKAIIPVHLYGEFCNTKILKLLHIPIVEDAAHALETAGVGTFGAFTCFSFYPIKSITCGDGGAIGFWDSKYTEVLKSLRAFGTTKSAWKRYERTYEHWDMDKLGYKCPMTNIDASLLIPQLARVKSLLARRRTIWNLYQEGLSTIKGIRLLKASGTGGSKLMMPIIVEDTTKRDKVMLGLQEKGIGIGVHFNPIHLMTYYRKKYGYKEGSYPIAEEIGHGEISLPIYPRITDEQVEYTIQCIKETMREV